jgi:uncharacterized membrane protein
MSVGQTPPSRYAPPRLWARLAVAFAAAGGTAVSMVLVRSRGVPGCGPGSGCNDVLASRWSHLGSMPISLAAIAVYAAVLLLLPRVRATEPIERQRWVWRALLACAAALLTAGVGYVMLQWTIIGRWCPWCMAAHGFGAATGVMILWLAPIGRERLLPDEPTDPLLIAPRRAVLVTAAAAACVAAAIGLQSLQPHRTVQINRFGGIVGQPRDVPMLGAADAPHPLVYLYDYTCPHCRTMHEQLRQVRERYGEQVVIVLMPVPLDAACNPAVAQTEPRHAGACDLARVALAAWRASPDAFEQVDEWLFGPEEPRHVDDARRMAGDLIGDARLDQLLDEGWPDQQIQRNVGLYRATGEGVLPRLMAGRLEIAGRPGEARELFDILERELGLVPRESVTSGP